MDATQELQVRELAKRSGAGIDVTLFWNPRRRLVFVEVEDHVHGEAFRLVVDPADALDAFNHPYAYERELACSPGLPV